MASQCPPFQKAQMLQSYRIKRIQKLVSDFSKPTTGFGPNVSGFAIPNEQFSTRHTAKQAEDKSTTEMQRLTKRNKDHNIYHGYCTDFIN